MYSGGEGLFLKQGHVCVYNYHIRAETVSYTWTTPALVAWPSVPYVG